MYIIYCKCTILSFRQIGYGLCKYEQSDLKKFLSEVFWSVIQKARLVIHIIYVVSIFVQM